jgi:hypothetical protein
LWTTHPETGGFSHETHVGTVGTVGFGTALGQQLALPSRQALYHIQLRQRKRSRAQEREEVEPHGVEEENYGDHLWKMYENVMYDDLCIIF